MNNKQKIAFGLFASIPIISVLFLFQFAPEGLGWGGIPKWIWGFTVIEILYCAMMFWFVKNVWQ